MDKPTTTRRGVSDFVGWLDGKPFCIESKAHGGKVSPEQAGELHWAALAGAKCAVVYSLSEAVIHIGNL